MSDYSMNFELLKLAARSAMDANLAKEQLVSALTVMNTRTAKVLEQIEAGETNIWYGVSPQTLTDVSELQVKFNDQMAFLARLMKTIGREDEVEDLLAAPIWWVDQNREA